jgi:hypothetical protein
MAGSALSHHGEPTLTIHSTPLTLKKVTTIYQQQIFQPTRKAIFVIMFNAQYVKYHI